MRPRISAFFLAIALAWSGSALAEAPYDAFQQVFTLSYLSNAVSDKKGTVPELQMLFRQRAESFFKKGVVVPLIGEWSIAWGPVVFEFCSDENKLVYKPFCEKAKAWTERATNAVFVAKKTVAGGEIYVVGIAATNPISRFDWAIEDAFVGVSEAWPYGKVPKETSPRISAGTDIGIKILMSRTDPNTKQSLENFLKSKAGKKNELYFAGHSLAGALSPALALAYFNDGAKLKKSDWKSVRVYPSAGATPGNAAFAGLFEKAFPTDPANHSTYKTWNADIWNALDVVPHAWKTGPLIGQEVGTLSAVPSLYGSKLTTAGQAAVDAAVVTARIISGLAGVTSWGMAYDKIPNQSLPGTQSATVTSFDEFVSQMRYQHVDAYPKLIGIETAYQIMSDQTKCDPEPAPAGCPK